MTQTPESNPQFTPAAKKRWEMIEEGMRRRILENAWCSECRDAVTMELQRATVERRMLILEGLCGRCGRRVVRTVEPD